VSFGIEPGRPGLLG